MQFDYYASIKEIEADRHRRRRLRDSGFQERTQSGMKLAMDRISKFTAMGSAMLFILSGIRLVWIAVFSKEGLQQRQSFPLWPLHRYSASINI